MYEELDEDILVGRVGATALDLHGESEVVIREPEVSEISGFW